MAGTKISALTAGIVPVAGDVFPGVQSAATVKVTASQLRQYVGAGLSNTSVTEVAGAYAADTYLAGSAITIPVAGGWRISTQYNCVFDMVKTGAGTAAFTITLRMGTLGTTGDAAIMSWAFGAGTAVIDSGMFSTWCIFKTVGSGTSALIRGIAECRHHLAATGLVSTGASGIGILQQLSAGFNSTTQTIIGLSINGGASFSGTNTLVQASALNV